MNNTGKEWLEFVKAQKETWVRISKGRGDMPPFVIAEREGVAPLIVVAPQVDKYKALHAANLCRKGLACEAMAIVTDGYGVKGGPTKEQKEQYQAIQEKHKSLQEAFLAGHPAVIEILTAVRYNADGTMSMWGCQYTIEGKKVIWGEEFGVDEESPHQVNDYDPWADEPQKKSPKGPVVGGMVAENLFQIMTSPSIFDMPLMQEAAERCGLANDADRQLYHTGRAIRKLLHQQNYLILECVPWKAEEGYGVLLRRMMEKFEELGDIYDLDKMATKEDFWRKYWS